MKLTRYEMIMLWVMAIVDLLKRIYLKIYPVLAIGFATIYTYGFISYSQFHYIKSSDYVKAVITATCLTILTLVYLVLLFKDQLDKKGGN